MIKNRIIKSMELVINNKTYTIDAHSDESLMNVLRDQLNLTGTKYGCGEGACGACKVLIDGTAVPSCITMIGTVAGKNITTVEGIATSNELHPVQKAFLDVDVFQCAYCASGMLISAVSLLKKNSKPSENEIIQGMQGNICRCGTYPRIVRAIQKAANQTNGNGQTN
jgi:aerobic-type carbon monoxide dehydrogenase small subunit (CoxS/CutS family)